MALPYLMFRYTVARIWQEPYSHHCSLPVLAARWALLTNEAASDLPTAFDNSNNNCERTNFPLMWERSLLGSDLRTVAVFGTNRPRSRRFTGT